MPFYAWMEGLKVDHPPYGPIRPRTALFAVWHSGQAASNRFTQPASPASPASPSPRCWVLRWGTTAATLVDPEHRWKMMKQMMNKNDENRYGKNWDDMAYAPHCTSALPWINGHMLLCVCMCAVQCIKMKWAHNSKHRTLGARDGIYLAATVSIVMYSSTA